MIMDAIEQIEKEILAELELSEESFVEPHIVIGRDRIVTLPECFKDPNCFAVQHDHNIETVTFDCPRYWDEHDLSTLAIHVVYQRSDGYKDAYPCKNIRVDESDPKLIHFDWTISANVTGASGKLSFIICAKKANSVGQLENCWHSLLNEEAHVAPSIEGEEHTLEIDPDTLTVILLRLSRIENSISNADIQCEIEGSISLSESSFSDDGEGNVTLVVPGASVKDDGNGNVTLIAAGLHAYDDAAGNVTIVI